ARLLSARGFDSLDAVDRFFHGSFVDMSSPFLIDGMKQAAILIANMVENNRKILIFGDYDVDGATATSIVYQILKSANANVHYFIPHRLDDGYGLSVENISKLYNDQFYDLVITVDCGITSFEAIDMIHKFGAKVIVTDHHLFVDHLPTPDVLVNPKLEPGTVYEDLCGAAVAFKLAWAVAQIISKTERVLPKFKDILTKCIPLAAIATVADVMPLKGENRLLVTKGLSMMLNNRSSLLPGLRQLITACHIDEGSMSSNDISFRLAPRLNAAGRMADANIVVDLLCSESDQQAIELARKLEQLNQERRILCEQVCDDVERCLLADPQFDQRHVFVAADKNWHKGVIGVVAARMAERYHRPVIIFSMDENDNWCGSARTSGDVDVKAALDDCSNLLIRYGGHRGAAGLAVKQENFHAFISKIEQAVGKRSDEDQPLHRLYIDAQAEHHYVDISLAEKLIDLEPYGEGNRRPLLLVQSLRLLKARTIGTNDRHL
ncbi:MAG: single-stranded-DNA-specific exonuclease RecJ, partial [Lentisphaeria bacterium]